MKLVRDGDWTFGGDIALPVQSCWQPWWTGCPFLTTCKGQRRPWMCHKATGEKGGWHGCVTRKSWDLQTWDNPASVNAEVSERQSSQRTSQKKHLLWNLPRRSFKKKSEPPSAVTFDLQLHVQIWISDCFRRRVSNDVYAYNCMNIGVVYSICTFIRIILLYRFWFLGSVTSKQPWWLKRRRWIIGTMKTLSFVPGVGTKRTRLFLTSVF